MWKSGSGGNGVGGDLGVARSAGHWELISGVDLESGHKNDSGLLAIDLGTGLTNELGTGLANDLGAVLPIVIV